MRWIRFTAGGKTAYGILEGERITEVTGDPFAGYEKTSKTHALGSVTIEVPVIPKTFYCAGLNYTTHIKEVAAKRGVEPDIPKKADIGYRANNALVAHQQNVVIPKDATDKIQYEGELVVVIGKTAKHLTAANALSCVLGYTIGNDVSERTWQRSDRTLWRAKNTDTFKPMGPWIETDVKLDDKMQTIIKVNGQPSLQFPTNDMLFGVVHFLVEMTKYLTLVPGDVVWMGTDGSSPDLKHGDLVDVEITGIGTLTNKFVRAS